jgi:hypothetical protein
MKYGKRFVHVPLMGLAVLAGCQSGDEAPAGGEGASVDPETWEGDVAAATRPLRPAEGTDADWNVLKETVTMAWEEGLDTLPLGESMVRIGGYFIGADYTPGTLELAGPESVVVNFQEFDCVTLVENVFTLARFIRIADADLLESGIRTKTLYRRLLGEIRYWGGRVDGYPSRLHYFSDWIRDNEARGLVQELTQELGGEEDRKAIDFMSTHPESYRQLADPGNLSAVRGLEFDLSASTRFKIPEEEIATWSSWIQDGDIIATTSTLDGLDVAHTGIAVWQGAELHLLHAPLVGEVVEMSRLSLADRILRFSSQDGIRVARPLDQEAGGGEAFIP